MDELLKSVDAAATQGLSRRSFIKLGLLSGAASASSLSLGFFTATEAQAAESASWLPNAFVRLEASGKITVYAKHLEMGQGSYTGLATLVAEELDADWKNVQVIGAPANAKLYNNLFWGPTQGTGGSSAMANSWEQMRKAGATVKAMLVQAAAQSWQVPAEQVQAQDGVLSHASGKRASYGELVAAASQLAVPEKVTLKQPAQFRLIGKKIPRRDSLEKTTGKAIFTQDIQLPGQLTALVAHAPRFGSKVKSFDAKATKKVAGVVDVFAIPQGVAVVATNFWAAKKGRDALKVVWDDSQAVAKSTPELWQEYQTLAAKDGALALQKGDLAAAQQASKKTVQAEFRFPFLAHATMEPMNCVVKLNAKGAELWYGAQIQTLDQGYVAKRLNCPVENVVIHTLYAGGSFGRRGNKDADYVMEAVEIAAKLGQDKAVKLVWTREDDMRAGYFRPMYLHQVSAGVDADGKISFWQQRVVGQSIMQGSAFEGMALKNGVDHTSVEGIAPVNYQTAAIKVDSHIYPLAVPVLWLRSVGHTHTAYVKEVMMDQLAKAAAQDPLQFRLQHTSDKRQLGVLQLLAEKSGWQQPLAGKPAAVKRARGIAVHDSFNSVVGHVAEVSVLADGGYRVDKVITAVDCGIAINPDIIKAQIEGSIGMALSALKYQQITLKNGAVEQSNFHDFACLRIAEMPQVEVHIVPSANPPTGIGEPGVPPLAPAVANALAAITGKWPSQLPFDKVAV